MHGAVTVCQSVLKSIMGEAKPHVVGFGSLLLFESLEVGFFEISYSTEFARAFSVLAQAEGVTPSTAIFAATHYLRTLPPRAVWS